MPNNKVKFTDTYIKKLAPQDKRYTIREDRPKAEGGFAIRVTPNNAKSWYMIYYFHEDNNKWSKWLFLGKYPDLSLSKARTKFKEMRELLAEGKDPSKILKEQKTLRREAWTVETLAKEFIEKYCEVHKKPRSVKEDRQNLDRDIIPTIGKRKATDITRGDIIEIIDAIMKRGARTQANRTLATIRKMFNWALEREVVQNNPVYGISRPSQESPRERTLSKAEIKTLWKELEEKAPQGISLALKLVLLTGARPGEVLALTSKQLEQEWIDIPSSSTKNKKPHKVYISSLARKTIESTQTEFIFISPTGKQIKNYTLSTWIRNSKFYGIEAWTPHDLRRTCATLLASQRTPPHIIDRVLNHVQQSVTGRVYDQYNYATEVAQALERLSQTIETAINKKTDNNLIQIHRN